MSVTQDTLRYYEKVGAIPKVGRTEGGIRCYTAEDLEWINNAICMRSAGMSVEAIAEYVRLYRMGDGTFAQRRDLLCRERETLLQQLSLLEQAKKLLDYKIERYQLAVETGILSWDSPSEAN